MGRHTLPVEKPQCGEHEGARADRAESGHGGDAPWDPPTNGRLSHRGEQCLGMPAGDQEHATLAAGSLASVRLCSATPPSLATSPPLGDTTVMA